jgi:hypothetical protein
VKGIADTGFLVSELELERIPPYRAVPQCRSKGKRGRQGQRGERC